MALIEQAGPLLHVSHGVAQVRETRLHHGPPGDEEQVPAGVDRRAARYLSHAPARTVPYDGPEGHTAADDEAETRVRQSVGRRAQHEEGMGSGDAALAERLKVTLPPEPLVASEGLAHHGRRPTRTGTAPVVRPPTRDGP